MLSNVGMFAKLKGEKRYLGVVLVYCIFLNIIYIAYLQNTIKRIYLYCFSWKATQSWGGPEAIIKGLGLEVKTLVGKWTFFFF